MKDADAIMAGPHAMASRSFQFGTITLLAMSMVGSTFTPNFMLERYDALWQRQLGGLVFIKRATNRLMSYSLIIGVVIGARHLASLPLALQQQSSYPSTKAIRDAAIIPVMLLGSLVHVCSGPLSTGEGIMIGTGSYLQLALGMVLALHCHHASHLYPYCPLPLD